MRRFFLVNKWVVFGFLLVLGPTFAHAALIGVSDPAGPSLLGGTASIIAAPSDATDDAAFNDAQQGFNEAQNVFLPINISVDGGGVISAGTLVNSHMIFLNTGPGNIATLNRHWGVEWTFDGAILGIMSDGTGSLEVASSGFLGAAGTTYPLASFPARGLEGNVGGNSSTGDGYTILNPTTLQVGMHVTEPGDWIRVVTQASVPEPSTLLLFGSALVGLAGFYRRDRRR